MRKLKNYLYVLPTVAPIARGSGGSTSADDEVYSSFKGVRPSSSSKTAILSSVNKKKVDPHSTSCKYCINLNQPNRKGFCPDGWRLFTYDDYEIFRECSNVYNGGLKGFSVRYTKLE